MQHATSPGRPALAALSLLCALVGAACSPSVRPAPSPEPQPVRLSHSIVPAPASVELSGQDSFTVTATTGIATAGSPEVARIAEHLAEILRPSTGFPIPVSTSGTAAPGGITLSLAGDRADLGAEGYQLRIAPDAVTLTAAEPAGLFHGIQTLRQLLPPAVEAEQSATYKGPWQLPTGTIVDRPRFSWRGAMLDVSRHFFTVHEVKQYIDALALYKLNILHLHLSDDQGWRIAIDSRPRLTEIGAVTQVGGGPGGFYSKQDYAEIVRYAQERYITVVPEIDMPGHTNAALVAYPSFSCSKWPPAVYTGVQVGFSAFCVDNEETYRFVEDVVREISAMTPGPYFHIGGDEVEALTHEQYAHFIERVQEIVRRHGKRMVGWEEVTKARLHPTSIAQQWKSDSATAALKHGAKLVLSPAKRVYLDMKYDADTELGLAWAGLVEVRDAYDWEPATYLKGVPESEILGVEAPLWTETVRNLTAAQYLAFPRLPAVAEVGWTPAQTRDWESFRRRVAQHAPRWRILGINYHRSPQIPWDR